MRRSNDKRLAGMLANAKKIAAAASSHHLAAINLRATRSAIMVYPFRYRHWMLLAIVALVIRGAAQIAAWNAWGPLPGLESDPDSYRILAETLHQTGTMGVPRPDGDVDPTAFRPPLYPYLLSWLVVAGRLPALHVALLHTVLGALTALLACDLARCWIIRQQQAFHPWTPCLAFALVAVDPLLVTQSTQVMTETLAAWMALLVPWILFRYERLAWPANSIVLALGFLTRPVFVIWTLLLLLWQAGSLLWRRSIRSPSAIPAVLLTVTPAVVISAWMIRNEHRLGAPVWATTHGGYTLLLGNNPYYYQYLHSHSLGEVCIWGDAWNADEFHRDWRGRMAKLDSQPKNTSHLQPLASDSELATDRLAQDWAKETIRSNRSTFFYACCVRIVYLWSPIPRLGSRVTAISYGLAVYYCAVYLCVGRAYWRIKRLIFSDLGIAAGLLAIALTTVHAVYWSNIRMRAPIMPIMLAVAALGAGVRLRVDSPKEFTQPAESAT